MKHRRYRSSVWFVRWVWPSVSGWYVKESLQEIRRMLHRCFQKWEINCGPRSLMMLSWRPWWPNTSRIIIFVVSWILELRSNTVECFVEYGREDVLSNTVECFVEYGWILELLELRSNTVECFVEYRDGRMFCRIRLFTGRVHTVHFWTATFVFYQNVWCPSLGV
jgi:hypothetical protein